MLCWTKKMGFEDWIAETIIDGKYISNGGKTSDEAFAKLAEYLKQTYNVESKLEGVLY